VHHSVDLVVQLVRHHPDDRRRRRRGTTRFRRQRRSVPITAGRRRVSGAVVERLRLYGDGDVVWDADDEDDNIDERHRDLGTSDVAVDGTLTRELYDNVSKTPGAWVHATAAGRSKLATH